MGDLLKVLSHYKLESGMTSRKEKILCPLHADKNASLAVDIDNNFWHCFGCDDSGDAYKFHKLYQNKLGVKNELEILRSYNSILKGGSKSSDLVQVKAEVKDRRYYRQKLIEAKDYYKGLKSIDWDEANDESIEYMLWRGFKRSTLNKAKAKYTYKDISYPLIFPILDNNKFKGWVCRTFDIEIGRSRKYLYNKGFRRSNTIAGTYKDAEVVMLVEGFMDMLKARQYGVKNVGAILGWKITKSQVEKLQEEGVKVVISALDNDACGKKGTNYLKQFFKVIRFEYPSYVKDTGEISRKDFIEAKNKVQAKLKRRNLKWE